MRILSFPLLLLLLLLVLAYWLRPPPTCHADHKLWPSDLYFFK
jgi:hypothetical protein